MSLKEIYPVPDAVKASALIDNDGYLEKYALSVSDPEAFWREQAKCVEWSKPFSNVKQVSYEPGNIDIRWFYDGELNVSVNCIDRHLADKADKTALIWEGDDPNQSEAISYRALSERVNQLANGLRELGVSKGDRVTIYMPMIPEATYAMLACARIGAVHSVVFGGFSPDALAGRIDDCGSKLVITADEGVRGGRTVPLKVNVDKALEKKGTECVEKVVVVKRTGAEVAWNESRDVAYNLLTDKQSTECEPETMSAEDPLFILYTSGSTGKPKGVLHTTGGYLVYAHTTTQYVFDLRADDIYWCTADVGWITGHSYIVYGPLSNGATSLVFEGVPNYPSAGRMGEIVDKHFIYRSYRYSSVNGNGRCCDCQ